MKKNLLFTICLLAHAVLFGQNSCPGGFFITQSQVDNFLIQNPDCDSAGELEIIFNADDSDPITNLDAFSNLQFVEDLSISNQGNFPESFVSLSPLSSIAGVINASFIDVYDFTGMENLIEVQGVLSINYTNVDQENISLAPFSNLINANTINLDISDPTAVLANVFPSLTTIQTLRIGNGFSNPEGMNVSELSGFDQVTELEIFEIGSSLGQPNHAGALDILNNVTHISTFLIDWLTCNSFEGFQSLETAGDMTFLIFCTSNNPIDFPVLQSAGDFWFWVNQELETNYVFPVLQSSGDIMLFQDFGSSLFSLSMPELVTINGNFEYTNYPGSTTNAPVVVDFSSLETIVGDFTIQGSFWDNLQAFSNLENIGGAVNIGANFMLSDCDIQALCQKLSVDPSAMTITNNAIGCNSLGDLAIDCQIGGISGTVYVDANCNGIADEGELPILNPVILGSNGLPIGQSASNGAYFIPFVPNTTFEIIPQQIIGTLPTTPIIVVTENDELVYSNNDFFLCPDPSFHDVSVTAFSFGPPTPGFSREYRIVVKNHSYNSESGQAVFDISNMPGVTIQNSYAGIVSGNTISYSFNNLPAFGEIIFQLLLKTIAATPLGTVQHPQVSVSIEIDSNTANNVFTWNQTVVGSYDPNDITVDKSAINYETFSPDNTWLHYTIRFQNTGTFPAEFVRVTDVIEEDLDLGTIDIISASHLYELSFVDNQVEWFFDNIQLPDSSSDLEGSQGYIHYKIRIKPDVDLVDLIENSAAIYFDFNEPVITNTATTEFYICPEQISASGVTEICEGDVTAIIASGGYDNYNWVINESIVSTEQSFGLENLSSGNYTLEYSGSTEFCNSSSEVEITINAIPGAPTITQNANTLTASGTGVYVWTFNGEVLSDTDNSISMDESGEYSVFVTTNACVSDVTTGNFIHTGIESLTNEFDFTFYPNPVNEKLMINTNTSGKVEINIYDSFGKIVLNKTINGSNTSIDCSGLSDGIYYLKLNTTNTESSMKMFVVSHQ